MMARPKSECEILLAENPPFSSSHVPEMAPEMAPLSQQYWDVFKYCPNVIEEDAMIDLQFIGTRESNYYDSLFRILLTQKRTITR